MAPLPHGRLPCRLQRQLHRLATLCRCTESWPQPAAWQAPGGFPGGAALLSYLYGSTLNQTGEPWRPPATAAR